MGPETGLKIAGVGVGNFAGGRVRRNECGQCGLCVALSDTFSLQPHSVGLALGRRLGLP